MALSGRRPGARPGEFRDDLVPGAIERIADGQSLFRPRAEGEALLQSRFADAGEHGSMDRLRPGIADRDGADDHGLVAVGAGEALPDPEPPGVPIEDDGRNGRALVPSGLDAAGDGSPGPAVHDDADERRVQPGSGIHGQGVALLAQAVRVHDQQPGRSPLAARRDLDRRLDQSVAEEVVIDPRELRPDVGRSERGIVVVDVLLNVDHRPDQRMKTRKPAAKAAVATTAEHSAFGFDNVRPARMAAAERRTIQARANP